MVQRPPKQALHFPTYFMTSMSVVKGAYLNAIRNYYIRREETDDLELETWSGIERHEVTMGQV